jgi:hypothetical protein
MPALRSDRLKPCSLIGTEIFLIRRLDSLFAIRSSLFGCAGNLTGKLWYSMLLAAVRLPWTTFIAQNSGIMAQAPPMPDRNTVAQLRHRPEVS